MEIKISVEKQDNGRWLAVTTNVNPPICETGLSFCEAVNPLAVRIQTEIKNHSLETIDTNAE